MTPRYHRGRKRGRASECEKQKSSTMGVRVGNDRTHKVDIATVKLLQLKAKLQNALLQASPL